MITVIQLAQVLQTIAVTALLVIVIFWALRTYRVDSVRQKLFEVRDNLFDYASSGAISFDDPAYILLRLQMNGLIRYAHQLSIFRFLLSVLIDHISGTATDQTWLVAWEQSLANIEDESVKQKLQSYHERAIYNALKHLIIGSPVLLVAVFFVMICLSVGHAGVASYSGIKGLAMKASWTVMRGPLDPRHLQEEVMMAT